MVLHLLCVSVVASSGRMLPVGNGVLPDRNVLGSTTGVVLTATVGSLPGKDQCDVARDVLRPITLSERAAPWTRTLARWELRARRKLPSRAP